MAIGTRKRTYHYEHESTNLGNVTVRIGDEEYLAQLAIRPSTPTIYNVTVNTNNWTAIATGLTGVLAWRLSERSGADFYFAFEAAPSAYCTAWGWVGDQSDISAIYAKRTGGAVLTMELLVWTV
jgi:hypothetical protein